MYRTLLGILAVFAVALLLVGVTFSSVKEEPADYVFVNGTEPKNLDPQKFTGQPEGRIGDALYEGLTYRDAKTQRPLPGAAESWDVSPDGRRWTFHIRPTSRWSNGDPVRAQDFVYAWVRLQEPEIAAEYAYLMHVVRHAEAFNTYEAQVKMLRGDPEAEKEPARQGIVRRVQAVFDAAGASGLAAAKWQELVEETSLRDAVTRTGEPALLAAFAKEQGVIAAQEGAAVLAAMTRDADRRAAALAEAQAHFGKDQGVFAPDDKTFVVELVAYTPYFLELTAFYPTYPVHRATVERWPTTWFREGQNVGNGPFVLERWTVNEKIRLRKSPTYWGRDTVHIETVDILPHDGRALALNLYLTGDAHWLPTMYPPDLIDVLKDRPDFYGSPGLATYFYRLNCSKKPFNDVRVRKALGMAFDRQVIVDNLTRKGEPVATTIVPPIEGYEPPEGSLKFDPAQAQKLLADAGYPGGSGFPEFSIVYNTDDMHKKIAEFIADSWSRNLGIKAVANNKEWQAILEDVRRLNYDVERAGWIGDYVDPNTFLDMWLTKGGNNQTGWGDPFYDRLIELARDPIAFAALPEGERASVIAELKEPEKARQHVANVNTAASVETRLAAAKALRFHLFREAEAILCQDALPILPIYFYQYTGIASPRIEGFYGWLEIDGKKVPNLQDLHPFREIRLKPAAEVAGAR